jgi:tRNA threonylcarbamoyl adenosine modification protein (Sua5/YciO/YrdC/YwlC family)
MLKKINLHSETPQLKKVFEVADALRSGSICLIPTESQYSVACLFSNKKGLERIRKIRNLEKNHTFTLLIDSMNGISRFAQVSDANFKLIKRLIPGPITFILPATKEVPKLLLHPRRKTIGFRVSAYPICEAIIRELGEPLLAVSARSSGEHKMETNVFDREELFEQYSKNVDIIIDNNETLFHHQTSVIDLTEEPATIHRQGLDFERVEEVFNIMNYDLDLEESF